MNRFEFGIMVKELFVLCLIVVSVKSYYDNSFELDVNDILDENLMPGNLLFLDGPYSNETLDSNTIPPSLTKLDDVDDGSILNAISTMGFHRKMINEYMCTNFMAEQILSESTPVISTKLQRRVGNGDNRPSGGIPSPSAINMELSKPDIKENMLFDPGSTGYKNWLAKTTTLEDIYKHYSVKPKSTTASRVSNKSSPDSSRRIMDGEIQRYDMGDDDYEEGDIKGYMIHKPLAHSIHNIMSGGHFDHNADISSGYSHHQPVGSKYGHYSGEQDDYEIYEHDEKDSKEMKLKDIFDIALTTLAFLSFGMFILHVLMCITMTKTDNNMIMMPMEEGEDVDSSTVEVKRRKRSQPRPPGPSVTEINEITRKVLKSIEAVLVAQEDRGACLNRILCENNNYARNRTDDQKIWIPVWGLGLTWLSTKMISVQPAATSMLENLRASVSGIGGADCMKIYPNCDAQIQVHERRKRRRRRETERYKLQLNF